jgi:hypothetical protein
VNIVRADFRTRSIEVENYFRFVRGLAEGTVELRSLPNQDVTSILPGQEELLKTLKASCYLLLYNLMESTMRNIVEAIFDDFQMKNVRYDACRSELKRIVLLNFRRRNPDKLMPKLLDLARDIITETFDKEEMFSGNLDARVIRETAERFGFTAPPSAQGWKLVTVKNARNDLAHGIKSFSEVGRDASASDLENARSQAVEILTTTIENVNTYLSKEEYLHGSASVVT